MMVGAALSLAMIYYGITLPRPDYPTLAGAAQGCVVCDGAAIQVRLAFQLVHYNQVTLPQRTMTQLGTGLLLGVPAALLIAALPAGTPKTRDGKTPTAKAGGVRAPIGVVVLLAGLASFALIAASDVYFAHTGDKGSFAYHVILFCDSVFGDHVGFSVAGALAVAAATLGATLAWSRRSLPDGLRKGVAFVAAPAAIALIAALREFDVKEMAIHATNFLAGLSVNHTDILSNWSVLIVAISVTFAGVYVAGEPSPGPKQGAFRIAMAAVLVMTLLFIATAVSTQTVAVG